VFMNDYTGRIQISVTCHPARHTAPFSVRLPEAYCTNRPQAHGMDCDLPEVQGDWEHPTLSAVGSRADIRDTENHSLVGSLGLVPDDDLDEDLCSMVDELVTEPLTKEEIWWQYLESLTLGPTSLRATEGTGGVILPWRPIDVTHADVQHSRVAGMTAMTEVQRRRRVDAPATASVASSIELPDAALASAWKERLRTNARKSQEPAARKLGPIGSSRLRPSGNERLAEASYGSRDTDLLGISTSLDADSSGAAQVSHPTSRHSLFNVPELVIDTDTPTPDAQDKNLEGEGDEGSDSTSRAAPGSAFGSITASAVSRVSLAVRPGIKPLAQPRGGRPDGAALSGRLPKWQCQDLPPRALSRTKAKVWDQSVTAPKTRLGPPWHPLLAVPAPELPGTRLQVHARG
jgi:hypothetical protein